MVHTQGIKDKYESLQQFGKAYKVSRQTRKLRKILQAVIFAWLQFEMPKTISSSLTSLKTT